MNRRVCFLLVLAMMAVVLDGCSARVADGAGGAGGSSGRDGGSSGSDAGDSCMQADCSGVGASGAEAGSGSCQCAGPAPGAPTIQCADGSLGGPVCAVQASGGCRWEIRGCPDSGASGGPCATSGDCPNGGLCGFLQSDRCSAIGRCFPAPTGPRCLIASQVGCGCEGTDVSIDPACYSGLPSGYQTKRVLHEGACMDGGSADLDARVDGADAGGHAFDACGDGGVWASAGLCTNGRLPHCSPHCAAGEYCHAVIGGVFTDASPNDLLGDCAPLPSGCSTCECLLGWCDPGGGFNWACGFQDGELVGVCYGP